MTRISLDLTEITLFVGNLLFKHWQQRKVAYTIDWGVNNHFHVIKGMLVGIFGAFFVGVSIYLISNFFLSFFTCLPRSSHVTKIWQAHHSFMYHYMFWGKTAMLSNKVAGCGAYIFMVVA